MPNQQTLEEFIEKAKKKHNDKYDYSKVNYVNNHTQITIICNKCKREFKITPKNHLRIGNCRHCYNKNTKTIEIFKKELDSNYKIIEEYVNTNIKIRFKCLKHNEIFFQKTTSYIK